MAKELCIDSHHVGNKIQLTLMMTKKKKTAEVDAKRAT
jgi:hypothetical protein